MRKLIVTNIASLDGYYEGPDQDVMALPMDHGFDAYNLQRLDSASSLVLGRKTYEMLSTAWPKISASKDATEVQRRIGEVESAMEKIVVSDTLTDEDLGEWSSTTTIVARCDATPIIDQLRSAGGGDVLVFGSRTMWTELLRAGLVDEFHVVVGNVAVGSGTPLFSDPQETFHCLGAQVLEDSNNVVLKYQLE